LGGTPTVGGAPNHAEAMAIALAAAEEALDAGEVPVGAALFVEGRLLAKAGNRRERDHDPTGHAEIVVLREAARHQGDWRLPRGSVLYVTLEPCPMCAYAIREARVERVVYGADDPRRGAAGSLYHLFGDPRLGPEVGVLAGVGALRSEALLRRFFAEQRGKDLGGVSEPG
jgi:tRNA(adenine34) deaminase